MPKVTVIIPTYNVEPYIAQCTNSILNQTLQDIEIIFIDDGSADQTGQILDSLTMGCSSARVIHQPNRGLYKAREIGLHLAKGEYVGWVDADDFIEPDLFEIMYNAAIEKNSELVICNYDWFPKRPAIKGKWFRKYKGKVDVTFVERNSQCWNKLVKRELLERLDIASHFVTCFDEIYIRVLMEAKNPVTIEKPLYHYRVGTGTMSSSYTNVAHYREFITASKELQKLMGPLYQETYWKDYFVYRVIYYTLMTMLVAANAGDRESYERYRQELLSMEPVYSKNRHYWKILRENYGFLKAAVIGGIIPFNYTLAHLACRVGMK